MANPVRVLVTGADGFIGRHLQRLLADRGFEYRVAVRGGSGAPDPRRHVVGDIGPRTDWSAAMDGVDVVVHLAGRAHILREHVADPRAEFMRVNADATATLARAAAATGVRRIVYMSSVGVLGNVTEGVPFTASSPARPHNAYAESKLAGEVAARAMASSSLDVAVVRPPLVYGSGVRANFLRLLQWTDKQWPLPLGAVDNKRSLVSVWNLCDLLVTLLAHPAAAQDWLVSDGEDLSTPELLRRVARMMGRRTVLLPVPTRLLQLAGRVLGREGEVKQLCGSLVLDTAATRNRLSWSAPVLVDEGLMRTVQWYLSPGDVKHA